MTNAHANEAPANEVDLNEVNGLVDDAGVAETVSSTGGRATGRQGRRRWLLGRENVPDRLALARDMDDDARHTSNPAGALAATDPPVSSSPPRKWPSIVSYCVVPALALLMVLGVGYLKYDVWTAKGDERAAAESVQAAKDGTVAILSYTPDTAEASLGAARDRLTGAFRDSYTSLTHDVVIPGAKQRKISATATVAVAASVSATESRAVVLVYVNQALTIGQDAPTSTASVVEVRLDHSGSRWLISGFDPK